MNFNNFVFQKPKPFYDSNHQQLYYIPKKRLNNTIDKIPILFYVGIESN